MVAPAKIPERSGLPPAPGRRCPRSFHADGTARAGAHRPSGTPTRCRRGAQTAAIALFILGAASARAQDRLPYQVTVSAAGWTPLAGGTVTQPVAYAPGFSAWDEGAAAIEIPFAFAWFGAARPILYAYTNGFIAFAPPPGAAPLYPPASVPSPTNAIHDFIAVAWTDLTGGPSAEIRSAVLGVAPDRVLAVQVLGLTRPTDPSAALAFQVRLHESSGAVDVTFGPSNGILDATTAVEDARGALGGALLAACPLVGCACAIGACGSANWPAGRTITVAPPSGPELAGAISGPRGASPGATFRARVDLESTGRLATGPFSYEVRLAPNSTSTAGSVLLATQSVPAGLGPGSTTTATVILTMPAAQPPGLYDLALLVDPANQVPESVPIARVAFDVRGIATVPDLTGALAVPARSGPGETLRAALTVRSDGAPVFGPVQVAFFLSADVVLDAGDLAMGAATVTLPDGFTGQASVPLVVPAQAPVSPTAYRVLAAIDDNHQYPDLRPANDVIASAGTVVLGHADLAAAWGVSGDLGFPGLAYPLTATISNGGGATARTFATCIALSRGPVISGPPGQVLLQVGPLTLAPGEAAPLHLAPVIPAGTATGAWFIGAIADCGGVVTEDARGNDVAVRAAPITVRAPAPDITPQAIATATAAASGETVPVTVHLANAGNAAGAVPLAIVLSTNPGLSAADPVIYRTPAPVALVPGQESTLAVWARLPDDLASGTYYLGARVDPEGTVAELGQAPADLASGPVAIAGADLAIASPPPPAAAVGVPYVWRFAATGASLPGAVPVWELTWSGGQAPAGFTFTATAAELRGTPSALALGRHPFTLQVTAGGRTVAREYALLITPPTIPLTVLSSRLFPALAGQAYRADLVAVGGVSPYTWAFAGAAPRGLGLSSAGVLGGEPLLVGAYTFAVTVTDSIGVTASGQLVLDVVDPDATLTILTADVPRGVVGMPYSTTFESAGGTPPLTWRLDPDGSIPGLTFDPAQATLTGTPAAAGAFPITVQVQDARGLVDRNAYLLPIVAPGDLVIDTGQATSELPPGHRGLPYRSAGGQPVALRANRRTHGDPGPLQWMVVEGDLPPGLGLGAADGVISGTPIKAGEHAFRVLATDAAGNMALASLAISVDGAGATGGGGCSCSAAPGRTRTTGQGALAGLGLLLGARMLRPGGSRRRLLRGRGAWLASAGLILLALSAAGCTGTRVGVIQPVLRVTPLHLDFGMVPLAQTAFRAVTLADPVEVADAITALELQDDCGGCFLAPEPVHRVEPRSSEPLKLRFRPVRVGAATATLAIGSDDPASPRIQVTMAGQGLDGARPDITVSPATVAFGRVPAGGLAVASFMIRSAGSATLAIDRIALDPPDAPFRVTTSTPSPANPGLLSPGTTAQVTLQVNVAAAATGTVGARILISSNVSEVKNVPGVPGAVAVPLIASAALPPRAAATAPQTVLPFSRVTLDGSMSSDPNTPPALPLAYQWTLRAKPGGSRAVMEHASLPGASFFADLTGDYEAELVVTNALGLQSAPAIVGVSARATNAVRIELVWDHPYSDLDLHLIDGATGMFCDCATDCHYRDCGRTPDWFPTMPGSNPRLDVDTRSGFGPENINIDGDGPMKLVQDGEYLITVHYYASNSATDPWPTEVSNATIRVFFFGLLAAELRRPLTNPGDLWYAGRIEWPQRQVAPDGRYLSGQMCGAL